MGVAVASGAHPVLSVARFLVSFLPPRNTTLTLTPPSGHASPNPYPPPIPDLPIRSFALLRHRRHACARPHTAALSLSFPRGSAGVSVLIMVSKVLRSEYQIHRHPPAISRFPRIFGFRRRVRARRRGRRVSRSRMSPLAFKMSPTNYPTVLPSRLCPMMRMPPMKMNPPTNPHDLPFQSSMHRYEKL